ncbi:Tfp pilus assembly protein FimT/FimU [Patescibacteria group bacterium]
MRQRGFTLIELLVVIAVIAILSLVVIVNYANYRQSSQLDITTQQIISTLRDAQSRSVAAKDAESYGVYFQVNAGADDEYVLFQGDSYAGGTTLTTFAVPSILGLSTVDFAGSTGNEVVFDELTGTTSNYGHVTVTLTGTSTEKDVSVSSEGRIGEYTLTETGFPGSFHLATPANGTIVGSLTPTFTWDPAGDATSYTLWHSTDPTYATYTEVAGITAHPTAPSYTLGGGRRASE